MRARFIGQPITRWREDGRNMVLVEDFTFIDNQGKPWTAPAGAAINGASIPRPLWQAVGSPYVGKHRNISIIHDHHCVVKTEHWYRVHHMFYEGCLAGGMNEFTAKIFSDAVKLFGPRWDEEGRNFPVPDIDSDTLRGLYEMGWAID